MYIENVSRLFLSPLEMQSKRNSYEKEIIMEGMHIYFLRKLQVHFWSDAVIMSKHDRKMTKLDLVMYKYLFFFCIESIRFIEFQWTN
jgi:predicted transcriptional regulator